ncbi:phosphoprotein membrane anchor with glycosphingolipid microdomains 1 L homeolog isoform X1 [Xenopus laevis]|uniref:phosphoprotein membrane anchor with glycosphingolipid microdomains 1 L homeolog isoform X1 n=2 Tax=Xenopus laevis TaxID=8355 RepID=A0A1L8FZC1_XENLA|nr:phosphoprotein membrane anchor with glycosphingolipid microdomains 1 L homeolog isoform X1 [Xenopus laevis]XP_018122039.1 phosphoprotein membrane anchor with glycosphingolipid microdomains 1 L homeolog isoform X1 [Xenopus laevis]XP_018122040.1 phosphoprotein membrane anchor with glycosphingolipid microdomains 1 L homeolog isoform X1 [Xenopus laevis]XP_018122042.1 phosphoprotein membrane anchor with glycosphingolipid microdomains 1 L homeolog isoform X1 [Xenopus laevis]XP_018122043.1 phosphop
MAPIVQEMVGSPSNDLSGEQAEFMAWGGLAAVSTIIVVSILLFLCSSCYREKKKKHQNGDHENLMTAPSDKETYSHSVTSLGTEAPTSSYRNGAVSNGNVSEDSSAACIQPYEDVQGSLPDLCDLQDCTGKSTRCHQSRELPRIPPNSNLETMLPAQGDENDLPLGNEGPYEVLKESSSHENIIEDCLYETVKEIKDVNGLSSKEERREERDRSLDDIGHPVSPRKQEFRIEAGAEYASVDHNRKSRQSINTQSAGSTPTSQEEDIPPPLPKKLLDENENVQSKEPEAESGAAEENLEGACQDDKRLSSVSYKSREEDPCLTEEDISAMYSTVSKMGQSFELQEEFSHYAYIQDIAQDTSPTTCNGTYATVRDLDKSPDIIAGPHATDKANGGSDPEYEAIANISREEERTMLYANAHGESDYESIGDLVQNADFTRL